MRATHRLEGSFLKKLFPLLFLFLAAVFAACGSNVLSTNLSQITFDSVTVGDSLGQLDTSRYTVKENVSDRYTYNYEECRVSEQNGIITEIMATFGAMTVSINGTEDCHTVDDIIGVLGENYHSSWYDREQSLMQIRYSDRDHGLECAFVYNKNSSSLVWAIMKNS